MMGAILMARHAVSLQRNPGASCLCYDAVTKNTVTGSGMVQLAFGFHKPVVVSNVGALSEVVCDKKTGFLVSPKNPDEIAKAVLTFFTESNKDEMVDRIKKEKDKFSWDHLVETIETFGEERG